MPKGQFRGGTGNNADRRTKYGRQTNGGGLNALGVRNGGSTSSRGSSRSRKAK